LTKAVVHKRFASNRHHLLFLFGDRHLFVLFSYCSRTTNAGSRIEDPCIKYHGIHKLAASKPSIIANQTKSL